jgi:hypothetical protein
MTLVVFLEVIKGETGLTVGVDKDLDRHIDGEGRTKTGVLSVGLGVQGKLIRFVPVTAAQKTRS